MESCGLSTHELFQFCDVTTFEVLRQTCKSYRQQIPLGWTKNYLFITDRKDKKGVPFQTFLQYQATCMSLQQIVCCHVQSTGPLVFSPKMIRLEDVSVIHAPHLERVQFDPAHCKLQTIMVYDSASIEELIIPPECSQLQEVTLVTMSLTKWTFRPEWTLLRTISLTNIGRFSALTIPASYTSLEFLQIADVGLRQLRLDMDLTDRKEVFDRLSIRLFERIPDEQLGRVPANFEIQIVTPKANWSWLDISSNCATSMRENA